MKRCIVALFCLVVAVSAWAAPNEVVVYTAHEESIINVLVPMFEKDTGIKVNYVKLASGDVMKRAKAEAANPQADVIWSIGGEQLEGDNQILQAYKPKDWDKIAPAYKVGTNWLAYTGIMNVFIVNTKMLKPEQYPHKWTDLTDARFKKSISSARADKSGSSYMQLANVMLIYGDKKGWEVYGGIMKNMVISTSSGAVPKFVNDGEQAVGITLEDNAFRFVQGGGPVAIVYPTDGTVAPADGMAILKGAPNLANAKIFVDWCLSKPVQEILVKEMARRPVRIDVASPKGLPAMNEIKTIPYDFGWASKNKTEFYKKFGDIAMDLGL
ncbi:MAG TPA: extracellular solute-binding protein [Rectinemataceae bacterium]|nr:extracellular solute-binding protein [Rectinemataceae bacterium]